jgi:peptidoglycan-associated lipoprotein
MIPSFSRAPLRSRLWYLPLIAVFLLGAADSKKKGCSCKPDEEPVEEEAVVEVQAVEVPLQVTSIDPATGEAGQRFDARVYGSAFEAGARVHIGDMQGMNPRVVDDNTISLTVPGMSEGTYDVIVTNPGGDRATLRRGMRIESSLPDCSFLRLYFEFDQARLVSDASVALDGFMECYQATQSRITIEGHCDERGTVEYNLALGQRRAAAVERYMATRGVSSSRLESLSYGEERPVDQGHSESAWSHNRRVDIYVGN